MAARIHMVTGFAAALMLLAGCSQSEEDSNADAGSAGDMAAASEASDYDVPKAEKGLAWFYKEADGNPSAVYGPPDAGGYVMLGCMDGAVEVILADVDALAGRETATLRSGPLSEDFESSFDDEGMSVLFFSVPADNPIVKRFANDGFYVSFPNGENNPFPPDGKLAQVVDQCAE